MRTYHPRHTTQLSQDPRMLDRNRGAKIIRRTQQSATAYNRLFRKDYTPDQMHHHDTLGGTMMNSALAKSRYWLFDTPGPRAWVPVTVILLFIGILFSLVFMMITAKIDAYKYSDTQQVLYSEVVQKTAPKSSTVPPECVTALQKADIGYSYAYYAALNRKHLSHRAYLHLQEVMDAQAKDYKQYREMCFQIANNGR